MYSKLQTKLERLEQSLVCAADCGDYEACEVLSRKVGKVNRLLSKFYKRAMDEAAAWEAANPLPINY